MQPPDYCLAPFRFKLSGGTSISFEITIQLDLLPAAAPYDAENITPDLGAWQITAAASSVMLNGYWISLPYATYDGPQLLQPGENVLKWEIADTVPIYAALAAWIATLPVSEDQGFIAGVWQSSRLFSMGSLGYFGDIVSVTISGDRIA